MARPINPAKAPLVINLLATLGYISCLLQWLWAVILFMPLIEKSHVIELLIPKPSHQTAPVHVASGSPSLLMMVIAVIVTVIILGITVYALAKIPVAIGKTGRKLTHDTATKVLMPAITHHHKLPAKKKFRLTLQLSFALKAVLLFIPFLLAVLSYGQPLPLGYHIILITAAFLAGVTVLCFAIQLLFVAFLHPNADTVW